MRKSYSTQLRLDSLPIDQVQLNFNCRDRIVPVLRALQYVYSKPEIADRIMSLVEQDVNGNTCTDCGREGMDYWQILVLASVRLGCDDTYDHLQELSENHNKLRAIMGVGSWDEDTEFRWRFVRDGNEHSLSHGEFAYPRRAAKDPFDVLRNGSGQHRGGLETA
jgi:hypothetical protein